MPAHSHSLKTTVFPLHGKMVLMFVFWKVRFTERRKGREKDLPSAGSLPKWPQQPKLRWSESRNIWVFHAGTGFQGFGPSSSIFPGHKQGAGREVEHLGYKPAPLWDPRVYKVRTLATRLLHQALSHKLFLSWIRLIATLSYSDQKPVHSQTQTMTSRKETGQNAFRRHAIICRG